jgi:hypothetical protein
MGVRPAVSETCPLTLLTFSYIWNILPTAENTNLNSNPFPSFNASAHMPPPPSLLPPLKESALVNSISLSMMGG